MLSSGELVEVDLGTPIGSEAGLRRPAVVVTAAGVLLGGPNAVQLVPLTRAIRASSAEITLEPAATGSPRARPRSAGTCTPPRSSA